MKDFFADTDLITKLVWACLVLLALAFAVGAIGFLGFFALEIYAAFGGVATSIFLFFAAMLFGGPALMMALG